MVCFEVRPGERRRIMIVTGSGQPYTWPLTLAILVGGIATGLVLLVALVRWA